MLLFNSIFWRNSSCFAGILFCYCFWLCRVAMVTQHESKVHRVWLLWMCLFMMEYLSVWSCCFLFTISIWLWHTWKFRSSYSISYISYIGQCDLINTCFRLLWVWHTSGSQWCRICYLDSRKFIFTLIRSYWPSLSNGDLIRLS